MSSISALKNIHLNGQFGDYEDKNEKDLLKITEKKDLLIVQIVQYKNSTLLFDSLTIDGLKLINKPLSVSNNNDTRILWNGPKNWLLTSTKLDLIKEIQEKGFKIVRVERLERKFFHIGKYKGFESFMTPYHGLKVS